jgi:tartrate dehydratase beta subunit/fumarate hydratase class I family protein
MAISTTDVAVDRDLEQSIESTLSDYGLLKVPPEDVQAVVVVHTATAAKRTRSEPYDSWEVGAGGPTTNNNGSTNRVL